LTEQSSGTHPEAERWDARYQDELEGWLARGPRQLLLDHVDLLPGSGLALDAAAGVGHSSLFLARRGLHVIALDISRVALRAAARAAHQDTLPVYPAVYDLAFPWLPPSRFDVILNFHFLERLALEVYRQALKPGGLLFIETFVRTEEDMADARFYLEPGELHAKFSDFETILYEEAGLPPSCRRKARGVVRLVARKPD
jgi:SAM-dependent methyltransferase